MENRLTDKQMSMLIHMIHQVRIGALGDDDDQNLFMHMFPDDIVGNVNRVRLNMQIELKDLEKDEASNLITLLRENRVPEAYSQLEVLI